MKTNTGCHMVLKNVRHVPDMYLNLICTREFDDEGYYSIQGGGKWSISKGNLVVGRG